MKSVRRYSLRLAFQCALFLLLVLAANGPARAQGRAEVAQGEYQVYNAVLDLMQFPKRDAHIIIADTTLNRRCGGDSGNPVLVNNCGIWAPPSSAEEIFRLLRDSWPKLGKPTWDDLVSKSSTSSTLQDKLTTPWAHRLVDVAHGAAEEGWKTPDGLGHIKSQEFLTQLAQASGITTPTRPFTGFIDEIMCWTHA